MCAFLNVVLNKERGKGLAHSQQVSIFYIFPQPGHRNIINTCILEVAWQVEDLLTDFLEDGIWSAEDNLGSELIITVKGKESLY